MADGFAIEVDTADLIAALDKLGPLAERYVKEVAFGTAGRVKDEIVGRLNRETAGTGQTATNMVVEEEDGGYVVYAKAIKRPGNVTLWLEHGTKFQVPEPKFGPSARLEEGPHRRRLEDALEAAIVEAGLA